MVVVPWSRCSCTQPASVLNRIVSSDGALEPTKCDRAISRATHAGARLHPSSIRRRGGRCHRGPPDDWAQ